MYPVLFDRYETIFVIWGVAVLGGIVLCLALARRDGHDTVRALFALVLIAITFIVGTKVHFWLANPDLVRSVGTADLLRYGFHFPGGLIACILLAPLTLRVLGLRVLPFLDSISPAIAFAIALARLGCFANGCCFGYVSAQPWAIAFPPGSRAYEHHLDAGLIALGAPLSLPVLPMMLFFSAASLGIGWILWRWRWRFVGQRVLALIAMWSVANVVIEYWRDPTMVPGTPHLWGVSLAIAAIAVPALWTLSSRHAAARSPQLIHQPPGR
jgi:phosphatidylglycerol---prolipoprotein diacylglyceryl transferase